MHESYRAGTLSCRAFMRYVSCRALSEGLIGDLEQMLLALALCNIDEVVIGQALGLLQHRTVNHDVVVARETPDYPNGSISDRCKSKAQFGERSLFDLTDEAAHYVV